ncbi:AbrB/MazE/SpoVT family DNA-binding domain-containing protein [Patescibacteria group bacterium]|nr:AbrB/MazE/SpoVT family DNA-binding domain-containing protein [Patescibacteria group bacterium]
MQQAPVGELVKIMERGAVTLPAKYRKKLGLKKGQVVNVIQIGSDGLFIMPVDIVPKKRGADWTKDTPSEYMNKVRYNLANQLRTQQARRAL